MIDATPARQCAVIPAQGCHSREGESGNLSAAACIDAKPVPPLMADS